MLLYIYWFESVNFFLSIFTLIFCILKHFCCHFVSRNYSFQFLLLYSRSFLHQCAAMCSIYYKQKRDASSVTPAPTHNNKKETLPRRAQIEAYLGFISINFIRLSIQPKWIQILIILFVTFVHLDLLMKTHIYVIHYHAKQKAKRQFPARFALKKNVLNILENIWNFT